MNFVEEKGLVQITDESAIKEMVIDVINQNFAKSDYFEPTLHIDKLDHVFLTNKYLNEFRRKVYALAFEEFNKLNREHLTPVKVKIIKKAFPFSDFQIVQDECQKLEKSNIIYSPDNFEIKNIIDFKTKCESLGKKCFIDTPNFALEKDIKMLEDIIKQTNLPIVVNNYYALNFDCEKIIGAGLNIYNSLSANILNMPFLTAESEHTSRIDYPYMTLRHCPMKEHLKGNCANCPYKEGYEYVMPNGKTMKLKRIKINSCTFYLTD